MSLVNMNDMLEQARQNNYAVGAFNVYNIEDTIAVLSAAQELEVPIIVMTSMSALEHSGLEELAAVISIKAAKNPRPVCLHLDHATEFATILKAIKAGYRSVMFDGSTLPYHENVKRTKEIVKIARPLGVSVEGEIGRVGRGEEGEDVGGMVLSEPKMVKKFVAETDVDACAIAIGTQHGMQKQRAEIDYQRLSRIRKLVDLPLVLHGSSGVSNEDLARLSQGSIQKINIGTRLKRVYTDTLREQISQNPDIHDQIKLQKPSIAAVKEEVKKKLKYISTAG